MKMTVHSTDRFVEVNGITARIWEGKTANGVDVYCAVIQVACHRNSDNSELERDLIEHEPASPEAMLAFDPEVHPVTMTRSIEDELAAKKALSELVRLAVRRAMTDAWNDICSDTDCHPLDIEKRGRKLYFEPRHWADLIAQILEPFLNKRFADAVASSDELAEALRDLIVLLDGGRPDKPYHWSEVKTRVSDAAYAALSRYSASKQKGEAS